MLNRRLALATAGAAVLGAAAPLMSGTIADDAFAQAGTRVRANVNSRAGQRNLQILERAWDMMVRDRSARNGRSLDWHAQFHARQMHPINPNAIAHERWTFLPWHRLFLLQFENAVMRLTGETSFALPYWDYRSDPFIPPALFQRPFNNAARRAGVPALNFSRARERLSGIPYAFIGRGARFRSVFGSPNGMGEVESGGHALVHVAVGGEMDSPYSPRDVLFWLHHSNVDRIWRTWHRNQIGADYDNGWLAEVEGRLPSGLGIPVWGQGFETLPFDYCTWYGRRDRARTCVARLALNENGRGWRGYRYDQLSEATVFFSAIPRGPIAGRKIARVRTQAFTVTAPQTYAIPLDLPEEAVSLASGDLRFSGAASLKLILRGQRLRSVAYRAWLANSLAGPRIPAGTLTSFMGGGDHGGGHHAGADALAFETDLKAALISATPSGARPRVILLIEAIDPLELSPASTRIETLDAEITVELTEHRALR